MITCIANNMKKQQKWSTKMFFWVCNQVMISTFNATWYMSSRARSETGKAGMIRAVITGISIHCICTVMLNDNPTKGTFAKHSERVHRKHTTRLYIPFLHACINKRQSSWAEWWPDQQKHYIHLSSRSNVQGQIIIMTMTQVPASKVFKEGLVIQSKWWFSKYGRLEDHGTICKNSLFV